METKRKPFGAKVVGDENVLEEKVRPKFAGEAKVIEIKMKVNQGKHSRERKTLQHISSKRPPFVELKGVKELRNSL